VRIRNVNVTKMVHSHFLNFPNVAQKVLARKIIHKNRMIMLNLLGLLGVDDIGIKFAIEYYDGYRKGIEKEEIYCV